MAAASHSALRGRKPERAPRGGFRWCGVGNIHIEWRPPKHRLGPALSPEVRSYTALLTGAVQLSCQTMPISSVLSQTECQRQLPMMPLSHDHLKDAFASCTG